MPNLARDLLKTAGFKSERPLKALKRLKLRGIASGRGLRLVNRYRFLFHRFKPECRGAQ